MANEMEMEQEAGGVDDEMTPKKRREQLLQQWKELRSAGSQKFQNAQEQFNKASEQNVTPEELQSAQQRQSMGNITQASLDFLGAGSGANVKSHKQTAANIAAQPGQELQERQGLADKMRKQAMEEQKMGQEEVKGQYEKAKAGKELFNESQQLREFSPEEQTALKQYFGENIPEDMSQFEMRSALEKAMQQKKQQETNESKIDQQLRMQQQQLYQSGKGMQKFVDMEGPDGKTIKGVFDPLTGELKPLEGSIVPQKAATQSPAQLQKEYKAFNDNITKNFNVREAHTAIQEYNKSLENLTPKEAKEADKLAREQLGLLVGKFDAGAKSNPVTSLNQLGSSILKYVNTGKFHTKNPAVGEAAMKRLNSAIKMAGLNKASGRDSVFQTQFNLSNAFGGIISGQTVPEEKINGLLNSLERRSGGALQQGLAFSSNKEAMKEAAKETFGDYFDDYLGKYNSLNKKEKEKVGKSFAQPEMEEGEVIETDKEPMTFDQFNKLKKKSSLLNEFRQGRQA